MGCQWNEVLKTDYSGQRLTPKFKVEFYKSGIFAFNSLSSQLLRVGIHHIMPLKWYTLIYKRLHILLIVMVKQ